jgi:hypothetical protein
MRVDLPSRASIQRNKLVHEVFAGLLRIFGVTLKVCEAAFGDGAVSDLLSEQIHLVQEED